MASRPKLYQDALAYWSDVDANVNGMLGGYAHISNTDINGSAKFIRKYIRGDNARTTSHRALDCGAGIGRITKRLLTPLFDSVDMVDVNPKFISEAKSFLDKDVSRIGEFFVVGLQDFTPKEGHYNVIWIQWVLGHLTDDDLVKFFQRCQRGLAEGGLVIVKENCGSKPDTVFDDTDSSYTRPKSEYVRLIEAAGLKILNEEKQTGFPKHIFDVWMFACV